MSGADERRMLAESAARFVERAYDAPARAASLAAPHGCAPAQWQAFAGMGWLALAVPEDRGGLGGSLGDACVIAEALGRGLVSEPYVAQAVIAAPLLAAAAPALADRCLPALAEGRERIALAVAEPGARFDFGSPSTRVSRGAGGARLDGVKTRAIGASGARHLLVSARIDDRPALLLVDADAPGIVVRDIALIDGTHAADVRFDAVALADGAVIARDGGAALEDALDRGSVAACAETVGAMQAALELTLDYLKTRKQFGRPLAENQALQHRLADLYVAIEECRALATAAAATLDANAFGAPTRATRMAASAARVRVCQAARLVAEETVQLHGAIGMTEAYALGAYVKRLAVQQTLHGDCEYHLERLARLEWNEAADHD